MSKYFLILITFLVFSGCTIKIYDIKQIEETNNTFISVSKDKNNSYLKEKPYL